MSVVLAGGRQAVSEGLTRHCAWCRELLTVDAALLCDRWREAVAAAVARLPPRKSRERRTLRDWRADLGRIAAWAGVDVPERVRWRL